MLTNPSDATTGGANVISCENVTKSDADFCCNYSHGCCDSGFGRFQVQLNSDVLTLGSNGAPISTAPPTSSSSSSLPSNTSQSSPSSTPINSNSSSGLSTGAIAGIAVACVIVGLALLGGLAYCLWNKRNNTGGSPDRTVEANGNHALPEISSTSQPAELMTSERNHTAELSA